MECGASSAKYGVWSVDCEVKGVSVECGVRKGRVRSAESKCKVESVECEV